MNTRKLLVLVLIFIFALLSACASATTTPTVTATLVPAMVAPPTEASSTVSGNLIPETGAGQNNVKLSALPGQSSVPSNKVGQRGYRTPQSSQYWDNNSKPPIQPFVDTQPNGFKTPQMSDMPSPQAWFKTPPYSSVP